MKQDFYLSSGQNTLGASFIIRSIRVNAGNNWIYVPAINTTLNPWTANTILPTTLQSPVLEAIVTPGPTLPTQLGPQNLQNPQISAYDYPQNYDPGQINAPAQQSHLKFANVNGLSVPDSTFQRGNARWAGVTFTNLVNSAGGCFLQVNIGGTLYNLTGPQDTIPALGSFTYTLGQGGKFPLLDQTVLFASANVNADVLLLS